MLFEHPKVELFTLSRKDPDHLLYAYASAPFTLDGCEWPSVEHYYQAMKFDDPEYREEIRQAADPAAAVKLGKSRRHQRRKDWKKTSIVVMTRGTYIKCRSYPAIAQLLLDSGDITIAELSMYDYFWGSGRDMRGMNNFGKMLMAVRQKLREEARQQAPLAAAE